MQPSPSFESAPEYAPRIGIPYRRADEERPLDWQRIRPYVEAIEQAGGIPELVSLFLSQDELARRASQLDGFLLPGSSADLDPARYSQPPAPETIPADARREQTDVALLDSAFRAGKPVLAICYGTQLLNVYRGGTLVQDIRSELHGSLAHSKERGVPEPHHPVHLVPGSLVAELAETGDALVNSSHHQSIRRPGRDLRVTAKSPDGVIEAVELDNPSHWVVGVQWHPERLRNCAREDAETGVRLSRALFRDLIRAASQARARSAEALNEISSNTEGR